MYKNKLFCPGQTILINPNSNLYKGSYKVTILNKNFNLLKVSMPYYEGKIILLGVGTQVKIIINENVINGTIVEKNHSKDNYLIISIPNTFSNNTPTKKRNSPKIITVTSGKGGVGKTNFVVNTAINFSRKGLKTIIIDADLGTANIDVILNLKPLYTLQDIIEGNKNNILDIIIEGPEGINIIPGGSGFQNLADLSEKELSALIEKLEPLQEFADIILIDTGAGLSRNVTNFALAADEIIVITTTEPPAITDAYAIIKVLCEKSKSLNIKLVVNRTDSKKEAIELINRMENVVEKFLNTNIKGIGYIFEDSNVRKAVKKYMPFIIYSPSSATTKCFKKITETIIQTDNNKNKNFNFISKLKKIFQPKTK